MKYELPKIIPKTCQECKYYKRTGRIDRFKGYCNFYDRVTYSSHQCYGLSLVDDGIISKDSIRDKIPIGIEEKKSTKSSKKLSNILVAIGIAAIIIPELLSSSESMSTAYIIVSLFGVFCFIAGILNRLIEGEYREKGSQ